MELHIHLHHHSDPAQVAAIERIAVAVEAISKQGDQTGKVASLTKRINKAADELLTVVAANPDPDLTD